MIIDDLRVEERYGMIERSARLRWEGGGDERRLTFSVPREMGRRDDDASPFLAPYLLQAMLVGEDLEIEGPVSARLLAASEEAQDIYRCWAPSLRRTTVRVAGETTARDQASGFGCFFSRGVDSMFSAAAERQGELTHLIFVVDLDPINDGATHAEEIRLARAAAARLGLPLVLAFSNIRPLSDPVVDWADLVGPGMAAIAQCLDGGLGRVLVPSSQDWATMGPCGTSPVLDPLFSTESLEVEHGDMSKGRHGKIAWLAAERPDLLPLLKVCYAENRPDNCGRCFKCLWTMGSLEAAGALERASSFPPDIDLELIRKLRPRNFTPRLFMLHVAQSLEAAGRDPELSEAIRHSLHRTVRPSLRERVRSNFARLRRREPVFDPARSTSAIVFYREQTNAALSVLRNGAHRVDREADSRSVPAS